MKIKFIKPSVELTFPMDGMDMLKHIERAGRTCYKSEDKITDDSCLKFVKMICDRGHDSVLEHASFSARFICDRGVSHELVRHRLASFSQESTRYVGYKDAIEFIIPCWLDDIKPTETELEEQYYSHCLDGSSMTHGDFDNSFWLKQMYRSAMSYKNLLKLGWRPEQARSVLPNSLKTEIVMTANLREWRHVFSLRRSMAAHPQMREVMDLAWEQANNHIPVVFEGL